MTSPPTILHITADYPDCISQLTTHAVYNLIERSTRFNHLVYSINRDLPCRPTRFLEDVAATAVTYPGLPYGIGLSTSLRHLAKQIGNQLPDAHSFDLIHAHKLTIEGVVADRLAQRFNKPLLVTVRGETDLRIMRLKPSYRRLYHGIIERSATLFFLAPWTQRMLSHQTGIPLDRKAVLLPNITSALDHATPQLPVASNRFITACRFDAKNYPNKRIVATVQGFNQAAATCPDITLDIAGSGDAPPRTKLLQLIASLEHGHRIQLIESMDNATFCSRLPRYAAFIRPSYPETFGMVFLEALFAGVPVLFARDTAIDGYLSEAPYALAVDHRSIADIATAIIGLDRDQTDLKQLLASHIQAGKLDRFGESHILNTYADAVAAALAPSGNHPT